MAVSVVIADDYEMTRMVSRLILEGQPDISVIGEASNGIEAIDAVRRLRPDVCLLNIRIPKMDGIEATRQIREGNRVAAGVTKIVLTTKYDLDRDVYDALRVGAHGFVVKNSGPRPLIEAVRAAVTEDSLVSPSMTVRLLKYLSDPPRAEYTTACARRLTSRERKIVHLLARGSTNSEIAQQLTLTVNTVSSYLCRIQYKISARNRVEIAAWAWEHGIAG
ncbi:response regulator [Streptomyces sp. NPDC055210]